MRPPFGPVDWSGVLTTSSRARLPSGEAEASGCGCSSAGETSAAQAFGPVDWGRPPLSGTKRFSDTERHATSSFPGDFGLTSTLFDSPPGEVGTSDIIDQCLLEVTPSWPEIENCQEDLSCTPARFTRDCDEEAPVPSVSVLDNLATGLLGGGEGSARVTSSGLPCSFWTRKPPALAEIDLTKAGIQWMFMRIDPGRAVCPTGSTFYSGVLSSYSNVFLVSGVYPFACYEDLGEGYTAAGGELTGSWQRFRYWVGVMHFPLVLGDWEGGLGAGPEFLNGIGGRVGAFMNLCHGLRAYTVRRKKWQFDSQPCVRFLRATAEYPCGQNEDFETTDVGEDVSAIVGVEELTYSGLYYQPATDELGAAAFRRALPEVPCYSLLSRMAVGQVRVYRSAGSRASVPTLAPDGFRCLFGRKVEVGIEVDYLPASGDDVVSAVSRACVDADSSLVTVDKLRERVQSFLDLDPNGLLFHPSDINSIEEDRDGAG